MPPAMPPRQSSADSIRSARIMNGGFAPSDLSTPISRVRSITVVYMVRKITSKPMETARAIMAPMNPWNICRGHQGEQIFQRAHGVTRKVLRLPHVFHHIFRVLRACAFDEENRGLVMRANKILQRGDGNENA